MVGPRCVVAVVPAFDPSDALLGALRALLPQVREVVVVDDGSSDTAIFEAAERLGARVVRSSTNRGIAAALNSGVRAAISATEPPEYILTIDQDSIVSAHFVATELESLALAHQHRIAVGAVAPERISEVPQRRRKARGGVVIGSETIQSGLLIPVSTFERVGLFDEGLFIDGVDADFSIRCSDAGLSIVVAPGTSVEHRLGYRAPLTFLGRRIRFGGHAPSVIRSAPFRYYYIARNRIHLNRRHLLKHPLWAIRATLLDWRHFAVVLIATDRRRIHISMIRAGVRDGFRGQRGRRRDAP